MKKKFRIVAIIILFAMLFQLYRQWRLNRFEKHGVITYATISGYHDPQRGLTFLKYYFQVKNRNFESTYSSGNFKFDSLDKFIGKKIPVIYLSTDPEYNSLLLEESDFQRYSKKMPENMNWIKSYLKD